MEVFRTPLDKQIFFLPTTMFLPPCKTTTPFLTAPRLLHLPQQFYFVSHKFHAFPTPPSNFLLRIAQNNSAFFAYSHICRSWDCFLIDSLLLSSLKNRSHPEFFFKHLYLCVFPSISTFNRLVVILGSSGETDPFNNLCLVAYILTRQVPLP